MSFSIIGTGSAAPSQTKTNDELAQVMDTSDAWIREKTGIEQRLLLGGETITDLAEAAARQALKDSDTDARTLDLIICATVTGEYITPSMACIVQRRIGATCPAFDISAACAGFLYAWEVALGYFQRKPDSRILIIGAEGLSRLIDWNDRSTAVIFGDGAGAVVLGAGDGLKAIHLNARGDETALYAKYQRGNCPFSQQAANSGPAGREQSRADNGGQIKASDRIEADGRIDETQPSRGSAAQIQTSGEENTFLHMEGQRVFQFAVSSMCRDLKHIARQAGIAFEDIDYVLPHQANQRIIDYAISRLPIAKEKYLCNIKRRGNTSAAAIPILLDEFYRKGQFAPGDMLAFSAFGAGLTSAAAILRWDKSASK